jgi:hypothetical protein
MGTAHATIALMASAQLSLRHLSMKPPGTMKKKKETKATSEKDGSKRTCKIGRTMHYQTEKVPHGTPKEKQTKIRKETLG